MVDLGLFTQDQLDHMRKEFAQIEGMDPCERGGAYDRLCSILDKMSMRQLKQVTEAKIKFMSSLARNRVVKREAVMQDIRNAGKGGFR